jgi:hypothetical protein
MKFKQEEDAMKRHQENKSEPLKFKIAGHRWLMPINPSYSGGRNQEDRGSKPAQENSSARPYLEKTLHKNRAGGVVQDKGPEFKPQYYHNNKKIIKV